MELLLTRFGLRCKGRLCSHINCSFQLRFVIVNARKTIDTLITLHQLSIRVPQLIRKALLGGGCAGGVFDDKAEAYDDDAEDK